MSSLVVVVALVLVDESPSPSVMSAPVLPTCDAFEVAVSVGSTNHGLSSRQPATPAITAKIVAPARLHLARSAIDSGVDQSITASNGAAGQKRAVPRSPARLRHFPWAEVRR